MRANKTHISLETAKLLKDCGVESKYVFLETYVDTGEAPIIDLDVVEKGTNLGGDDFQEIAPAYTWQEILWENAEKFFGNKKLVIRNNKTKHIKLEERKSNSEWENASYIFVHFSMHILSLLQQKKYQEADKYFRDNNNLIK